ncbi:CPBP family intramembrane glutamic endopeptidase [Rhodovulum adriaticum]|uniref:CAAX prenyl protease-like protein n=1 Tax=Rhodovulum adriaticum TaxID=35804 RepID=A0A4R2NLP3_RHOAD|nr:CPBP family intramembrane glutamic endopeptidase [Rhodovulum adriaticum]MBK1636019.1 hypothetical protein [Rhodovulum adriaticum]TCP22451.1 CAAX prenyl protease-like protein [Rhodovulum adriaticum]
MQAKEFQGEIRPTSALRLWGEFLAFYLITPLAMAFVLPPDALFPGLFALTALGLVLLHLTPGFDWAELGRGTRRIAWRPVALFTVATLTVATCAVLVTAPGAFLVLPREQPILWLAILLLYPPLSALPQEIVFRPLFFRRYGRLLPGRPWALVLNAALFSLAHLFYWNGLVAAMTFCGGLAFAWAYDSRGNFPMAVVLHALAGWIVFTLGLGMFFYSGNIQRPF